MTNSEQNEKKRNDLRILAQYADTKQLKAMLVHCDEAKKIVMDELDARIEHLDSAENER